MFSRFTSFIEVGGRTGLGYRDTAQDAMTIPHSNPDKCRGRIIELLRALTKEGYGLHLFEPRWFEPEEKPQSFKSPTVVPTPDKSQIVHGLKDACADDALWRRTKQGMWLNADQQSRVSQWLVEYTQQKLSLAS